MKKIIFLIFGLSLVSKCQASVSCGPNTGVCCSIGESCCSLANGTYGCFPENNAICCKDSSLACKEEFSCHIEFGMCIQGDMVIPPMQPSRLASLCHAKRELNLAVVKDSDCGVGTCAGNFTCCKTVGLCCPLINGVCCNDNEHCCPEHYKCSNTGCTLSTNFSLKSTGSIPLNHHRSQRAGTVYCPDHTACFNNQTCCPLKDGKFGCCPDDKGVCCQDGIHCCPRNTQCDIVHQRCTKKKDLISLVDPAVKKFLSNAVAKPSSTQIVCPDPNYHCGDNTTCCSLPSGSYGCCPYPNAMCCSDGNHCCPSGYYCDNRQQRCVSSFLRSDNAIRQISNPKFDVMPQWATEEKVELARKVKAELASNKRDRNLTDVLCPDKQSVCEDGTTCCAMSDGTYGCCPYNNAICCSDHQHCCPAGYTCDLTHQQCAKQATKLEAPISFVIIESFSDKNKPENQYEAEEELESAMPIVKELFTFMDSMVDQFVNDIESQTKPAAGSSCSSVDALVIGCPLGTSCCKPVGPGQKAICCPGESVSCCPGGFCCSGESTCDPLTLTCQPRQQSRKRERATMGFEP